MAAVVPQKRSTSPASGQDADHAHSPSLSKQPRLDASFSSEPAKPDGTVRGFKVPKAIREVEKSASAEMGSMETTYLSTQFEVDDSSEYKESLLALEGLVAKTAYPTRQHIRQLLSLCLFPLLFKPPTRVSAFARATASSTSTKTKPILGPFDEDPFTLTHKKLREEARKVLDDLIATNGVEVVSRSIRGYGLPKLSKPSSSSALEDPFSANPTTSSPSAVAPSAPSRDYKSGSKGRKGKQKSVQSTGASSDEDLSLSDSDDVLAISAKRIGQTENLWDFLAGTTAKKQRVWKREEPVLDGGWEILRSLVDGWQVELDKKKGTAHASDSPIEPVSLMRYFKPSATSSIARELSSKALDVAFWPFTDSASPAVDSDSDSDNSESDDDDLFDDDDFGGTVQGKAKSDARLKAKDDSESKFVGGMSLEEKKEVGVRLLCLIGELSTFAHFDAGATLGEFVQRMKALPHSSFPSFLELISAFSDPASPFLPRLLVTYLESHSHPLSVTASIDVKSLASLSSSKLAGSSADNLTSPRKRALAASSSLTSLPSDGTSQQSQLPSGSTPGRQSQAQVEAEFWKTPDFESKGFLVLASRIPIEVPIAIAASGPGGKGAGAARRPQGRLISSERSTKAAECHRLVKEVLIARKLEDSEARSVSETDREKWIARVTTVLEGVEEVVENAKLNK